METAQEAGSSVSSASKLQEKLPSSRQIHACEHFAYACSNADQSRFDNNVLSPFALHRNQLQKDNFSILYQLIRSVHKLEVRKPSAKLAPAQIPVVTHKIPYSRSLNEREPEVSNFKSGVHNGFLNPVSSPEPDLHGSLPEPKQTALIPGPFRAQIAFVTAEAANS